MFNVSYVLNERQDTLETYLKYYFPSIVYLNFIKFQILSFAIINSKKNFQLKDNSCYDHDSRYSYLIKYS